MIIGCKIEKILSPYAVNSALRYKKKKNNAQQQNVKNAAIDTVITWLRFSSNFFTSVIFFSCKNCSVFVSLTTIPPKLLYVTIHSVLSNFYNTIVHVSLKFAKRPQQNKLKIYSTAVSISSSDYMRCILLL